MTLRLLSYLAPSVPEALFEALASSMRSRLGDEVELTFDPSRSGPRPGEHEPFTAGEVDVAFVCATSYVWLTDRPDPAVELVGAAWAPLDPRAAGRAIYFGDVLAPRSGARSLSELTGVRVAYNDDVSLSGYYSLRFALATAGVDLARVRFVRSGSHLASLELLIAGDVEAAAIDSNVWRRRRRASPALDHDLHPIAALGPHPTQPVVARTDLSPRRRDQVRAALLDAADDPTAAEALTTAELSGFVRVTDADFDALRSQLATLAGPPTAASTDGSRTPQREIPTTDGS